MRRSIFLSYELNLETPGYGGVESFSISRQEKIGPNKSSRSIQFTTSTHSGTHMDFPAHFCQDGKTLSDYQADDFFFEKIAVASLDALILNGLLIEDISPENVGYHGADVGECDLLLIRTGWSLKRGTNDYWERGYGFSANGAKNLLKKLPKLKALGLDTISLTSYQHREEGRGAHRSLLCGDRALLIIEDMNLEPLAREIPRSVLALPLRITKADGSPCTVVAEVG